MTGSELLLGLGATKAVYRATKDAMGMGICINCGRGDWQRVHECRSPGCNMKFCIVKYKRSSLMDRITNRTSGKIDSRFNKETPDLLDGPGSHYKCKSILKRRFPGEVNYIDLYYKYILNIEENRYHHFKNKNPMPAIKDENLYKPSDKPWEDFYCYNHWVRKFKLKELYEDIEIGGSE